MILLIQQNVILFGTGARFSILVLDQLQAHSIKPVALVLPQYAPALKKELGDVLVEPVSTDNPFVSYAKRLSIPLIYLPESLQASSAQKIAAYKADFHLVACWPYLLSPEIINTAHSAVLNMHPSLLPNYRGADPVAAQIDRQEKKLGVSLHLMSQAFDKGDIVAQAELAPGAIFPASDQIEARAAEVGTELFVKAMQDFGGPNWKPRAQ